MRPDLYSVLGLSASATGEEIRNAYRRLAMRWHPDRHLNASGPDRARAEEEFKNIEAAYRTLGDVSKRREYDDCYGTHSTFEHRSWQDFDPRAKSSQSRRKPDPIRGEDVHCKVTIDVLTAIHGGDASIEISAEERCWVCNGTGKHERYRCHKCAGAGRIYSGETFESYRSRVCRTCDGRGFIWSCSICKGKGLVETTGQFHFDVPANTPAGRVFRFAGHGSPGQYGGASGDVYCEIRVRKSGSMFLRGLDIHCDVKIDCITAMLGGKSLVDVAGRTFEVEIPKGFGQGKSLRLDGMGLLDKKTGQAGDAIAKIILTLPKGRFTEEELDHLRRFAGRPTVAIDEQSRGDRSPRTQDQRTQADHGSPPPFTQQHRTPSFSSGVFLIRPLNGDERVQHERARRVFLEWEAALYKKVIPNKQPIDIVAKRRELDQAERGNAAFAPGNTPRIVIDLLVAFRSAGFGEKLSVTGNYALLVYATAAGYTIENAVSIGLYGKCLEILTAKGIGKSTIQRALHSVDPTFRYQYGSHGSIRARNDAGFIVEITGAQKSSGTVAVGDDDIAQTLSAFGISRLLSDGRISAIVFGAKGEMERLNAITPTSFCAFADWLVKLPTVDPIVKSNFLRMRDLAAQLGEGLVPTKRPLRSTADLRKAR